MHKEIVNFCAKKLNSVPIIIDDVICQTKTEIDQHFPNRFVLKILDISLWDMAEKHVEK